MTTADLLVVEDDPADLELTLGALKELHLANPIEVARDGVEALEYMFPKGAPPRRPKAILLDLKLPRVSGLEVLARLKADPATREIPVIIMTSSREAPDLERAYELGVNSYLVKPVEFAGFVDVIRRAGMYWMFLNETPR
jgi:CheY-like chemotaxis protein